MREDAQVSNTYKTAPYWVLQLRYGEIKHDHRFGYCKVEAPAPYSFHGEWSHLDRCPRLTVVKVLCDGRMWCWEAANARLEAKMAGLVPEPGGCGGIHDSWATDYKIYCKTCAVDVPHCYVQVPYSEVRLNHISSTLPRWWRKHVRHASARGAERRVLGIARGEYNAGVRVDDEEFDEGRWEPRLGRKEGWWD